MADARSQELAFGHFGRAIYDPDEQSWSFQRSEQSTTRWKSLGEPKAIQAPFTEERRSPEAEPKEITSARHARQIKSLVRRCPEVQPASELLPRLIRNSESLSSIPHDPLKGNLYATGTAPSETYRHAIPIAAFPTGFTGSDVRFVRIQAQRRGWVDSRASWIEVPVIHGEEYVWKGEGAPIQQIALAEPLEGASGGSVAVRCLNRTVILRARLTGEGLKVDNGFEVTTGMTGGSSHADATFNPYFVRHFAVVDVRGAWSVWELEGRWGKKGKCLAQGSIFSEDADPKKIMEDGWARVLWCADPSIVAVASRRKLVMAAVSEDTGSTPPTTVLSLHDQPSWILGVLAVTKRPDYLCVLTSTHVLILKVGAEQLIGVPVETVASIPHFRNPADITLAMAAQRLGDHVKVMLLSSAHSKVAVYDLDLDHTDQVRVSLPSQLDLPSRDTIPNAGIIGLGIDELEYKIRRTELEHDRRAYIYRAAGIRFFSIVSLDSRLGLWQGLHYSQTSGSSLSTDVLSPEWEGRVGITAPKVKDENFVVDVDEEEQSEAEEAPVSWFIQRRQNRTRSREDPQWTISLEHLGKQVASGHHETCDLMDIIGELSETLQAQTIAGAVPLRTLLELGEQHVSVADLESAQARVEELEPPHARIRLSTQDTTDAEMGATDLVVRSISTSPPATLSETYNEMVADWITPLPRSIPGRIRLAREQIIRQAAATLALSSRVVRSEPVQHPLDGRPESQPQPSQQCFDLPVRDRPSSLPTLTSSPLPLLPTPSPTATPSISTRSGVANPAIDRLRAYTSFTSLPTAPLPRRLSNVLSHWALGADPYAYDWRTASQRVTEAQAQVERDDLTEKERARMQRKRERDERRRRREVEESRKMLGRDAVVVVSASQGAPIRDRVEGESQTQSQSQSQKQPGVGIATASQVVGGRFGGRQPARKKRKQGF